MLKSLFKKVGDKAANKEMDNFLAYLQVGTESEMAMILTATSLARQFLSTSKNISRPFPEEYFQGTTAIDQNAIVELSLYNMELINLRKKLVSSDHDGYQLLASGLGVLIHTFRALSIPQLFPNGRILWKELLRGAGDYRECMREIRPDLDDKEIDQLWPVPNMLAPN
jgi:hypothetical protein